MLLREKHSYTTTIIWSIFAVVFFVFIAASFFIRPNFFNIPSVRALTTDAVTPNSLSSSDNDILDVAQVDELAPGDGVYQTAGKVSNPAKPAWIQCGFGSVELPDGAVVEDITFYWGHKNDSNWTLSTADSLTGVVWSPDGTDTFHNVSEYTVTTSDIDQNYTLTANLPTVKQLNAGIYLRFIGYGSGGKKNDVLFLDYCYFKVNYILKKQQAERGQQKGPESPPGKPEETGQARSEKDSLTEQGQGQGQEQEQGRGRRNIPQLTFGELASQVHKNSTYKTYLSVYNVTGLPESERTSSGIFSGVYFNGEKIGLLPSASYRIETHIKQIKQGASNILLGLADIPAHDNIPQGYVIDIGGADAPNISAVFGNPVIHPFIPEITEGKEKNTQKLKWKGNKETGRLIEGIIYGTEIKFWYVVDIPSSVSAKPTSVHFLAHDLGGSHPEMYNSFSSSPVELLTVNLPAVVYDAKGNEVKAELEFIDENQEVKEPSGETRLRLLKGKYKIKVKPKNHPIKKIEFRDAEIFTNLNTFIKLDDVPETGKFVRLYAIDPTALDFKDAVVTATAKGTELYKCKSWNFAERNCADNNWIKIMDIIPGRNYTFTLTPEDPGFGESGGAILPSSLSNSDGDAVNYANVDELAPGDGIYEITGKSSNPLNPAWIQCGFPTHGSRDSFDTAGFGATIPFGITTVNGSEFWIANEALPAKVYHVNSTGTLINSFDIESPWGIDTVNGSEFWILSTSNRIFHVNSTGALINQINISGVTGTNSGITTVNGSEFWITNVTNAEVYHIDSAGNVIDSFDTAGFGATTPYDITTVDGSKFWILDDGAVRVYEVNSSGGLINSIKLQGISGEGGITTVDGSEFWIVDDVAYEVYHVTPVVPTGAIINDITFYWGHKDDTNWALTTQDPYAGVVWNPDGASTFYDVTDYTVSTTDIDESYTLTTNLPTVSQLNAGIYVRFIGYDANGGKEDDLRLDYCYYVPTYTVGLLTVSVPTVVSLPSVAVSTGSQTNTSSFATGGTQAIIVTDQRGTDAGWSVTMTATSFLCQETDGTYCRLSFGNDNDDYRLIPFASTAFNSTVTSPNTALTITPGSITAISGSLTGVSAGGAETLANTLTPNDDISDPKTLMTAGPGSGTGQYSQNSEIRLDIPANPFAAPANGYRSVFTITVS